MRISLIAALDLHFAIGKSGKLPWHLPDDLKRFKALTLGKPVLMGRKTAQSLGRALPQRKNLVLTRRTSAPFSGMETVESIEQAMALCQVDGAPELCVIGGGDVFALALPLADRMHLTWIQTQVEGADAFFPRFDPAQWRETVRIHHPINDAHVLAFDFVDYIRLD